jgi:ABC-type polysaccharide/polyol phosphate export permease
MVVDYIPAYRFRWLLYELVKRDLKLRYRGSMLGIAWTLLNPLLFMGVYTLVFSVIMRSTIQHYPLFLLSGLIPWLWFSGAVTQATNSIVDGGAYIGKTLMPAEILVLVPVLSNGVNFLITIVLFLPVALVMGINIGWALVFLPLLLSIGLCLTLGTAMVVAVVNVYFRDIQQIVAYVMTALFFLTPIFYARDAVPTNLEFLLVFNPIAGLIGAFQSVFFNGVPPRPEDLLVSAAFGAMILIVGLALYNNSRDSLGEYV